MSSKAIILVKSTNQAMRIEHLLNTQAISSKLIPVPRYLSSNCGNCLQISLMDKEKAAQIIKTNHLEIDGIVEMD